MVKGSQIGQGRSAEVFAWGDKQVLKLFRPETAAWVENEVIATRLAHSIGLPVPVIDDVLEVDGRPGIIYERLDGTRMQEEFLTKPWKIIPLTRKLAELHAAVHVNVISELPSQRQQMESRIWAVEVLSKNQKRGVLKALDQLPDDNVLCHGDMHPYNILMSSRGPIIIDWMDAGLGNPLADVAKTLLILRLSRSVPRNSAVRLFIGAVRYLTRTIYLEHYKHFRPVNNQQLAAWQLPVAASRLFAGIAGEQSELLAIIESSLTC
jgi:aminoglycoside phosphotransferase (APT) family kinase protein